MTQQERNANQDQIPFCEERQQLIEAFVEASRELVELQSQQTQNVISGDPDCVRFDDLLHMAREKKDQAKYALIAHRETHRC